MYIRNGEEFDIYALQFIGENQYPAGWFLDAGRRSDAEVYEVHHVPPPDIAANQKLVSNGFGQDEDDRWVQNWIIEAKTVDDLAVDAAALASLKTRLVAGVDDAIAAIYARWLRFEAAYVAREAAARAYVAAEYAGDAGVWVTAFSSAAGMSDAAAADLIITQADGLRAALVALDAIRMTKYGILAAADAADAQASHDSIIAQAAAIASAL